MYVYRSTPLPQFEDESEYKKSNIERLSPELYMLLDLIPSLIWKTSEQIILSCKSNSFFKSFSDSHILKMIDSLCEAEFVIKSFVDMSIEEEQAQPPYSYL